MNLLVFAGASEGRALAERLLDLPVRATLCVATEYGGEQLEDFADRFAVRIGRMDAGEMHALMDGTAYDLVIDATHPYAEVASAAIRAAADAARVLRLRLGRGESPKRDCDYVDSAAAAAADLANSEGNILLTTGVKDLPAFTAVPGYPERMYLRVLPTLESLRECVARGFRRDHIIAMQGPFIRELNRALMRQFVIRHLVTKDGGVEGGFPEKIQAAEDLGVRVVVIGRPPEEDGQSLEMIISIILTKLEN